MLKLILGRAGSGKTEKIMREINKHIEEKRGDLLLIVPEQYSHEAERELLSVCGAGLSLYGEVVSFSALARLIENRTGTHADLIDKGGRLLALSRAVSQVETRLRVYGAARSRPEIQKSLLEAVTEIKTAGINDETLAGLSENCDGALSDKLWDLSLILSAYEAVISQSGADPADRLSALAERIKTNKFTAGHVYLDGFTDFTEPEMGVIKSMMENGSPLTAALTCEGPEEGAGGFGVPPRGGGRAARDVGGNPPPARPPRPPGP
ncbi:MAG: ATP-dependent nuclease subunit B, partial [Oscillospiraceae bacterium]|nr:ATP-dependent nuclease subunit B [Oscillospiraceae bacterium]